MPTLALTDRFVDTLPRPERRTEYHDTIARGLVLRMTPNGIKTWTVRYRAVDGGTQRLTLGTYPTVTLRKARRRAESERGKIADGADPAAEKQAARRAAETARDDTFGALAKSYLAKHANTKRSGDEDARILRGDVLPYWERRLVTDIKRRDVRLILDRIIERGSPIAANRTLAVVRKTFNFAIENDWDLQGNPAALIKKPGQEQSRDRVLTDDELRLVWNACDATLRPALSAVTRLRLVTAQRGQEIARMRWTDIDGDWLTLSKDVTKNKREHRVYLSREAQQILDTVPRIVGCKWVFPGASDKAPLGDQKKAGKPIREWVLAQLQQTDPSVTTFDFTLHDLRRTASTKMAEAGIPQADIAKVLNHVEGGPRTTHVYNRYSYDKEKQLALDTWARVLRGILDQQPTSVVVPFARA